MEIYFGIYMIFGKKNQRKTVPEVATSHQGTTRGWARRGGLWAPHKSVGALLSPQER